MSEPECVLYRSWPRPDGPSRLEYLSSGAEDLLEVPAADLSQMLHARGLPLWGCDPEAFYAAVLPAVAAGRAWQAEAGYRGPRTGRERWAQLAGFPQVAADGTPYFLGTLVDVTARWRAERAGRAAADRLAAHLDNTPLAVAEWDAGFRLCRWAGAAEALFGWAAAEVLGKRPDEFPLVHPDDAGRVAEVVARLGAGADRRNVVFNRNLHKSGRVVHCEWHNSVLVGPAGGVASVLSLARDRTPEVEAGAAVARTEDRLRAALHHADMLGWEYDFPAGRATYSGDRAAFYGGADDDDPTVNVVHPLDRDRVRAAIDAAARGDGRLAVEFRGLARTSDGRPRWFLARGQVDGDVAGRPLRAVGVTAEITDRVRAADDRAAVDRELVAARAALPAAGWRGTGRALVADDEGNVRELVAVVLERAGFDVARAADGPAARDLFRADPEGFRLVVADLLMPGLEGDALLADLRTLRPGLPGVLVTGFSTRPLAPALRADPATRLLTKPFRVEHLLAAVRAVCEAGEGGLRVVARGASEGLGLPVWAGAAPRSRVGLRPGAGRQPPRG